MIYRELLDEGFVDEIDAICRALEAPNLTEFDGYSDKYYKAVDLATSPLAPRLVTDLDRVLESLRRHHSAITSQLGRHSLLDIYENHMDQITRCQWEEVTRSHNSFIGSGQQW